MSNTKTFVVPTCGRTAYNLLSPYDTDLKTEFLRVENDRFTTETSTTCKAECSTDLLGLGYTQALYNCAICMGLNSTDINTVTKPQLASSWGCSSCYDVVAPIAYYKNTLSNTVTSTVLPTDITNYLNNTDNYKTKVDSAWLSASQLNKGDTVRRYCVESPSFTMTVPEQTVSPQGGGGGVGNLGAILGGVFGGVALIGLLVGWWWYKRRQ